MSSRSNPRSEPRSLIVRRPQRLPLAVALALAVILAGCEYLAELVPTSCIAGGVECEGACVDLERSAEHCGACGNVCSGRDVCVHGRCQDGCSNGVRDGTETDVDCGGDCAPCGATRACREDGDCRSGDCRSGTCGGIASCEDGRMNGDETAVDCGGLCGPCRCTSGADCPSGVCDGQTCAEPTCSDGVKNGEEGDVDCAGTCPTMCADGLQCRFDWQCEHRTCIDGTCRAPSCSDTRMNGAETDTDCGGTTCPACAVAKFCARSEDCASGVCTGGRCAAPTCFDQVKNGTESDQDCGGSCAQKCATGHCNGPADCVSGQCSGGSCVELRYLSVTIPSTLKGKVTSVPAGIDCPNTCWAQFSAGTQVTLTATPSSGTYFGGWGQACSGRGSCTVSVDGPTPYSGVSVEASFVDAPPALWFQAPTSQTGFSQVVDVAADAAGHVYVLANLWQAGNVQTPATMTLAGTEVNTGRTISFVLAKFAPDGQAVWIQGYAGANYLQAARLALGASGVVVVGDYYPSVDFGDGPLTAPDADYDAFVVRFNLDGTLAWSRAISGTSKQSASGVAVSSSAVFVAGTDSYSKNFLVKYDLAGTRDPAWNKSFANASSLSSAPPLVAVAPGGGVLLASSFNSNEGTLDLGGGALSAAGHDVYLARFLDDGSHSWSRKFGHSVSGQTNEPRGLAVDSAGRIALTGVQSGYPTCSMDFGAAALPGSGACAPFFGVLDAAGNHLFSGLIAPGANTTGAMDERALVPVFQPDQTLLLAGSFYGGILPTGGTELATSLGSRDGFVLAYDKDGAFVAAQKRRLGDDTGCQTYVTALAVDSLGNLHPAGQGFACTNFGTRASMGAGTMFVAKVAP